MMELDDRRLFAQHREYHGLYRRIDAGGKWLGWQLPQFRQALLNVHDDIEYEYKERNYNFKCDDGVWIENKYNPELNNFNIKHTAQLPYYDIECRNYYTVEYDRWTLVCRWNGLFKGRECKTTVYGDLIKKYKDQGGCLHDGRWLKSKDKTEYCLLCKKVSRFAIKLTNDGIEDIQYAYVPYNPYRKRSNITNFPITTNFGYSLMTNNNLSITWPKYYVLPIDKPGIGC